MTDAPTPRRDRSTADELVIEVKIIPLVDGDTERRDRQLQAIVNLLQGVLGRRRESELRSERGCDLVSSDDDS